MDNNKYLSHHGIKGQRWGVEHGPPYPVRRTAGGKPKTTSIVKSRLKEKAASRAEKKHEALKRSVINNPKRLYKNRSEFTDKEINEIMSRIEKNQRMKDLGEKEVQRGERAYRRLAGYLTTTVAAATAVRALYGFANIK